jgi:OmcA/MtrC family decaheme c-type cytochrome
MNRGLRVHCFVSAALFLVVAGLCGCKGDDGKGCNVTHDDAGVTLLVCPDGTSTVMATADAGSACTIVAPDGGARKVVCGDGTEVVIPNTTGGTPCVVVSNGNGTSRLTCPGGDGGMVTVVVKNALVKFTDLSAAEKAAMDLKLTVNALSFPSTGKPVVGFNLSDSGGNSITGFPPADMRFALLKLVPASKGGNDTWVSYIAAGPAATAGAETAAATATATSGALVDNGDGSYTYTFVHDVTDAAHSGTTFDAAAVHRLAIIVSDTGNPFAPLNVVKDLIPATGADVTGQNEKVDGASCLQCHSSFRAKAGGTGAFHGGTRYDVKVCVACHNDQRRFTAVPGTPTAPTANLDLPNTVVVDPATGQSTWAGNAVALNGMAFIDFPVFIHAIHMGEELKLKGGTFSGVAKPYETTYPQDVRNCKQCHSLSLPGGAVDGGAALTALSPQADTFRTKPSRKACGSCHDDVSFVDPPPAGRVLHKAGALADDSACATCHTPSGTAKKSVDDTHVAVADPDPGATWFGGTNANTNAAWLPAAHALPAGAVAITYDVKSVVRDVNKHPSIVFRLLRKDPGTAAAAPVTFIPYVAGVTAEMMDGFANSPSVYFAFAVPQDGIKTPADYNATASGYLKTIWNQTATGAGAGTMTVDAAGYYTVTLTGVTIPDTATMLIGGVGYTYSLASTPPLVQINLPAYPYGAGVTVNGKPCAAGKMCGGLIVAAPDVYAVATDAASGGKYGARRDIVDNDKCNACHVQLGANPTFHAGQRNDGPTCAFCHRPNQTSSGWSASSSTFIHAIHGGSERTTGFNGHAGCPSGTTFADGTCTLANADPYYANVTYPGILKNCLQCHKPGTYDFSAAASANALPNLLPSTVGTGTYAADIGTSPYVTVSVPNVAPAVDYGTGFSTANLTSGTMNGTPCTTDAPCVCSLAKPCEASKTTLIESPITAACSSCHDSPTYVAHMRQMGGTFYGSRDSALAKTETCLLCHGAGAAAAISDVHGI